MPTPPFSINGDRFDQSTYVGRYLGFLDVIDPRTLSTSDEEIAEAQSLLDAFKAGKAPPGTTDDELWAARKKVNACMHPVLGEKINPLFRMACFIPVNVPMIAGMLMTTSVPGVLFWQWANQTYNSGMNYANRGGGEVAMDEIATNYALAVGTALGTASSLSYLTKVGPPLIKKLGSKPWAIPYMSVGLAGAANIYFSRRNEVTQGVPVCLADGTEVGVSQEAAKQGILQTVVSRGLGLPLPVIVLPPILVAGLSRVPGLGSPRVKVPLEVFAITTCLVGALPAVLASLPQKMELATASLEPRFHGLKDASGKPVATLFANKGL